MPFLLLCTVSQLLLIWPIVGVELVPISSQLEALLYHFTLSKYKLIRLFQ